LVCVRWDGVVGGVRDSGGEGEEYS
jgi:hypothetical protein